VRLVGYLKEIIRYDLVVNNFLYLCYLWVCWEELTLWYVQCNVQCSVSTNTAVFKLGYSHIGETRSGLRHFATSPKEVFSRCFHWNFSLA
jgi:hypothetical protein